MIEGKVTVTITNEGYFKIFVLAFAIMLLGLLFHHLKK